MVLAVGDVIFLDGGVFNYTLAEAFDDLDMITHGGQRRSYLSLKPICREQLFVGSPTLFYLTFGGLPPGAGNRQGLDPEDLRNVPHVPFRRFRENRIAASSIAFIFLNWTLFTAWAECKWRVGGNFSRGLASNATLMGQWQKQVEFFNTSGRVPVMQYIRSIPRMKPLGSAITGVFVSTFAMLSALWKTFSRGAGALARPRNAPELRKGVDTLPELENGKTSVDQFDAGLVTSVNCDTESHSDTSLERMNLNIERMNNNNLQTNIALAHLRLSLARMRFSLRKHGLLQDEDKEDEVEIEADLRRNPLQKTAEKEFLRR
ncbi:hypothetical protein B0H14DRAFT_2616904 [Mycena olivaceomarginata]|nr:hypothetical protein B0H14DRAFT_2616904 [Mycena olivaceomarginata]